ncbi:Rieske (2Fe-2S) protein [Halioxenophilus aromaticivorans]|uniref:Non-heme iron oxygenase ferredoxin subunit n=1 Tax=Halioxenophilus aromaticivorans TaxID=1306992 RepID=A0AAV3U6C3_9ALTE
MNSEYTRLFPVADLSPGQAKAVEIDGVDLLVCNAKGDFYAVQNMCTHQKAKLEGGRIRNCFISCPVHGVMFDLKTGVPKGTMTTIPLKTYDLRVVDEHLEVCVKDNTLA